MQSVLCKPGSAGIRRLALLACGWSAVAVAAAKLVPSHQWCHSASRSRSVRLQVEVEKTGNHQEDHHSARLIQTEASSQSALQPNLLSSAAPRRFYTAVFIFTGPIFINLLPDWASAVAGKPLNFTLAKEFGVDGVGAGRNQLKQNKSAVFSGKTLAASKVVIPKTTVGMFSMSIFV